MQSSDDAEADMKSKVVLACRASRAQATAEALAARQPARQSRRAGSGSLCAPGGPR